MVRVLDVATLEPVKEPDSTRRLDALKKGITVAAPPKPNFPGWDEVRLNRK